MSASNSVDAERLRFANLTDADRAALAAFRPVLQTEIQTVLAKFYDHVARYQDLVRLFGGQSGLDRARAAQAEHWLGLFEGKFDGNYVERVRRIGKAHERVGLEPRWYIGGYAFALGELLALVARTYRWKRRQCLAATQAITKAVLLDMDYAISVYIEEGKSTFAKRQNELASAFEQTVLTVVDKVSNAATAMKQTAHTMADAADETNRQSTAVAAASEQASANVQTVAAAAEELSSSVREIARQVAQSAQIATKAVGEAGRTNVQVQGLVEAAQKIGDVVKLINAIAAQTNLLALNATIEAARAGEAGKGFAVVASEVKSLANQTSKATEEIATQIGAIQAATKAAVVAIQGIGGTITEINGIATTIAAAVEEQGAATQEISRNVQQAAAGTSSVSSNIASVSQAATSAGAASAQVLAAAGHLATDATGLRSEVNSFLGKIRAG